MPPADPSTAGRLTPSAYMLSIRQQPERAKIATGGKEKDRKAIDPPPMVQLRVKDPQDPAQNYLQSPYYFVACNLWDPTEDRPADRGDAVDTPLVGSLVSSLHRLKDSDNNDGGFFVFGDISVKIEGQFRLKFTLFEILAGQVVSLQTIVSDEFTVYSAKSFPGMSESTFISRSFGDQGVRIRIRKENRKRPASRENNENSVYLSTRQDPAIVHSVGYPQTTYGQSIPRDYRYDDSNKRQRPSIGHVSQAYDQQQQNQPLPPTSRQQQQQQDWAYSQTQSGPVPYPTHSNVATSSANQGIPAPALESFNFRPHSADPHSMQPTYTGQQQHQYDSRYAAPNSASPNPHDPSRGYPDTRVNPNVQHQLHQPHQQPTTTTVVHRHAPNHTPERLQYQEMSPYPSTNNPHGNPTTRSYQPSAYYPPAVSHTTYQQ